MWEAKISIFCTRFFPISRSGQRAGDYRNLSSIQAGRRGFTSQEAKAASAGPEEQRAPTPSGTAGPGGLHRPGRGTTVHTGPRRSGTWQRRGRHRRGGSGRHRRGRTWPAALKRRGGPGLGTCGQAAGCCFCEPPLAGRDPAVPSPSSSPASLLTLFPLFSPTCPLLGRGSKMAAPRRIT